MRLPPALVALTPGDLAESDVRAFELRAAAAFEAGLRETVGWYLNNRAWCEAVQAGKYERQRLGLGE